jgi:hypothetical protein
MIHVLPGGFHCIRHYGLLANARWTLRMILVTRSLTMEWPPVGLDFRELEMALN